MGALVAFTDTTGRTNVIPQTLKMMDTLRHRGNDGFGVATDAETITSDSIDGLEKVGLDSSIAIGYNLEKILEKDILQPLSGEEVKFAIEGRIYPTNRSPDACRALSMLLRLKLDVTQFMNSMKGSYVFAAIHGHALIVARDRVGCRSLYEGEAGPFVAFAPEKKALCAVGMERQSVFQPGQHVLVQEGGVTRQEPFTAYRTNASQMDFESAAKVLSRMLLRSLNDRIGDVDEVALAYSGGLDSGVLAVLLKLLNRTPRLLHITAREGKDLDHASESAKELGLRLEISKISESEILSMMRGVLFRIEDKSVMKLTVALPTYLISRFARKLNIPIVLSGQGADELFGGYRRYLTMLETQDKETTMKALENDVLTCHQMNYQRDEQANAGAHVEMRLPFADCDLIDFSLSLPLEFKISREGGGKRKIILRRVAEMHGAPQLIYNSSKRAVQYSTGIDALIRKIARRAEMSVQEYIDKVSADAINRSIC